MKRAGHAPGDSFGFRHIVYAIVIVHAVLFPLSGYRAWVQVRSVELSANSDRAAPGTRIITHVVTSGRIPVSVEIVATQGRRRVLLGSMSIPSNDEAIYDPRFRRDSLTITLSGVSLANLSPGPAVVVATALGRPQFARMPPPVADTLSVTVPEENRGVVYDDK